MFIDNGRPAVLLHLAEVQASPQHSASRASAHACESTCSACSDRHGVYLEATTDP